MSRTVILSVLLAILIVIGASTPVWAAQLDARINPNTETSPFKITYLKTIFIEYPNGGNLYDELQGKEWTVSGIADSSNPGVQELIHELNRGIANDGSQIQITDLNVNYNFHLKARDVSTSIDYRVLLEGTLSDYVITKDSQRTLVDMGWRGMSTDKEINIDGVEINIPINILRDQEPEVYAYFAGTEAESVLGRNLIDADFILEQPLINWHFLFDPTGINVDAGTFGLDDSISGFVISSWTMGESSIREGRQVERVFEAEIMADNRYVVRSVQSADQGNISTVGFGALDILDGVEIVGVTPTPPSDYMTTSTGDFPVMIVYGMAGMAAIGGIGFFIFSNRSLKNTKSAQTGIDPSRLVGYETSASSGGYKTNRGEAQLKDDSDYQQTRSHYDEVQQSSPPPQSTPSQEEAACGCAASTEIGSECDCAMQGACLCDGTCRCSADICKEQVSSMS
ncbi:MAG: hypothetical protein OPY06_00320 [Nitrosopumilus sp.]|nr:hypothetical protein [Nitrosopumilus sp.]